ncbi:uncharacterized protein PHA67_010458 isoform 2-T2 [Liasis olivaceus]
MDVALGQSNKLKQRGPGNFEDENAWLQEWIHEELARGEICQKQYEALLGHHAQLCSLLQTKSLKPLEKKTQALQEELEETQEILQECQNRSRQRQLHIHKQEKENRRMAETVKDLEKKVFKQQLEEKSNKDTLKELRSEGNELKRHLSEWEAKWKTKNDRIRQKQQHIEKLSAVIQELSLKSQELHRSITFLEDNVVEAQQEIALFQRDALSGEMETTARGFLWEEQVCDQMILPTSNSSGCLEAAVGLGQGPASNPAVGSGFLPWLVLQAAMLAAALNSPALHPVQEVVPPFSYVKALRHLSLMTFNKIE